MIRPAGFFSLTSPLPWVLSLTLHAGAAAVLLGDSSATGGLTPVTKKGGEIRFMIAPGGPRASRLRRDEPAKGSSRGGISIPNPRVAEQKAANSEASDGATSAPVAPGSEDALRDYAGRARLRIQSELEGLNDIKKLPQRGLQLRLWLVQDGTVERLELSGFREAIDEESLRKIREKLRQAAPFEALPAGIPRLALKVPLQTRAVRQ